MGGKTNIYIFYYLTSSNLLKNPRRCVYSFSFPFTVKETEKLSNIFKVTRLVSGKARF